MSERSPTTLGSCIQEHPCAALLTIGVQGQACGSKRSFVLPRTVPTQKYLPAEISRPTHHFIHHHTFYYYKIKINGLFVRPVAKYLQITGLKAEILLN